MSRHDLYEIAAVEDDGTHPEDFAVYLKTLNRYFRAAIRETPADYLARLAKLIAEAERVLPSLQRYAAWSQDEFTERYADWDQQARILGEYFITWTTQAPRKCGATCWNPSARSGPCFPS